MTMSRPGIPVDGGAFACVPGFHRRIDDWLLSLPPAGPEGSGKPWTEADLLRLAPGVVYAPGKAGDMVIWNNLLPHGAGVNRTAVARVVQYGAEAGHTHHSMQLKLPVVTQRDCGGGGAASMSPVPEGSVTAESIEANRRYHQVVKS